MDAEGAQVREGREALELCDAVLAEPEGGEVCEGFEAFDLADAGVPKPLLLYDRRSFVNSDAND